MDNTPRMLFWGVDEFMVMAIPFFLGIIFGSVVIMLSGFVVRNFFCRWKRRYPKGVIVHVFYWKLPTQAFMRFGAFKSLPHSHLRDFLT